uniref:MADF domain-containing protein n=1 Tax=Clastoptera arizonana TaxID=38151 RepID=A0A1B6CRF6_9HEMI
MDNHEMIRQLLKCYETKRLLRDSKHHEYYNKNKREDLWREISQPMKLPVKDLKKKMTSLLRSHRRERSKENKSQVTGSGMFLLSQRFNSCSLKTNKILSCVHNCECTGLLLGCMTFSSESSQYYDILCCYDFCFYDNDCKINYWLHWVPREGHLSK